MPWFPLLAMFLQAGPPAPSLDYDRTAPLEVETREMAVRDGVRIQSISFAGPKGGRAEGFLVAPEKTIGKTGGIVWMHSGGKYENLPDAVLAAQIGAVSIVLEPSEPDEDPVKWRDAMIRAVVSIRRAFDVLAARADVDPRRIAYAGHSFGAMMGVVAVSDKRFKAAVFEVGLLGMSIHIRTSPHPWAAGIRKELGDKLEPFLKVLEPLDAVHYVGQLSPTVLLFQSARLDMGVPEKDALDFYNAASTPKRLEWYNTGHDVLDIAAISDRMRFLAGQLGLQPAEPVLKAKIGVAK